jgi:hypothetical protein
VSPTEGAGSVPRRVILINNLKGAFQNSLYGKSDLKYDLKRGFVTLDIIST